MLGINESKQLGLIKPSGTVSQLCGTSSGIHPRFSPYYLRRVTQDAKDPLTDLMIAEDIPFVRRDSKVIFSFPMKSPQGSVYSRSIGALEQLNLWLTYRTHWCDGNPSQTIYYDDHEFLQIQEWLWQHWDAVGGLSFFPKDDTVYDQEIMPYLEISEEEYLRAAERFPKQILWGKLIGFEKDDSTSSSQELACSGGSCEI
jgi:hypothetical protein